MSSILEKINEIIAPEFRQAISETAIILSDDDPQGTCKNITLKGNGQLLAYKFDRKEKKYKPNFPFFVGEKKVHEMCDYLIFYESYSKPNRLFVYACELQSNSKKDIKAISQMRAGYNLAYFLVETARRMLDYNTSSNEIIFKGIRFSTRSPDKYYNRNTSQNAWKILIPNTDIMYLEVLCGELYYIEDNLM